MSHFLDCIKYLNRRCVYRTGDKHSLFNNGTPSQLVAKPVQTSAVQVRYSNAADALKYSSRADGEPISGGGS